MASSFVQWSRFVRSPNDIIRRLLFGPKLAMAGIGLQNGARRRNRQRPPPHGAEDTALRVFSRRRQITQLRRLFFARRFILSHSISHWKRRFAVAPPEPGYSGLIHYSIFQSQTLLRPGSSAVSALGDRVTQSTLHYSPSGPEVVPGTAKLLLTVCCLSSLGLVVAWCSFFPTAVHTNCKVAYRIGKGLSARALAGEGTSGSPCRAVSAFQI